MTGFRLDTLRATVDFVDAAGGAGSTVAESVPPTISADSADPPDSPDAALAISQFVVAGSFSGGQFWYLPKLTLIETTGRSRATIVKTTFELLDVGPAGRVPPSHELIVVPAGGAIVLDKDPLGFGPWKEISSGVKAARVSVVIQFMDAAGGGGSVTAIAEVS